MFSRPVKIGLAVLSVVGLLAVTVALNARLSWRPVVIEFTPTFAPHGLNHCPIAWRGHNLWLLGGVVVADSSQSHALPMNWQSVRNWNRSSAQIIQASANERDITALSPVSADFARTNKDDGSQGIQLWRDKKVRLRLKEMPRGNSYGGMGAMPCTLLAFSPDGTRLIASSRLSGIKDLTEKRKGFCDYGAVLFDTRNGQQSARQSAFEGNFTDFAWSPDSTKVAGIAADGWVFILNARDGKLRTKFRAHKVFGAQIAWSPDGKTLVTASNPRVAIAPPGIGFDFKDTGDLWSRVGSNQGKVSTGTGANSHVIANKWNGETLVDGRTERLLKRFDVLTGKQIGSSLPLETGAVDVAFSPDGQQLAVGEHNFVLILDPGTLAIERRLRIPPLLTKASYPLPVCVAWNSDSDTLATSTQLGIALWRAR